MPDLDICMSASVHEVQVVLLILQVFTLRWYKYPQCLDLRAEESHVIRDVKPSRCGWASSKSTQSALGRRVGAQPIGAPVQGCCDLLIESFAVFHRLLLTKNQVP